MLKSWFILIFFRSNFKSHWLGWFIDFISSKLLLKHHQLVLFLPITYRSDNLHIFPPVLHIFANGDHETRRWFRRFKLLVVHAIFTQKIPQLLWSTTLGPQLGFLVDFGWLFCSCWQKIMVWVSKPFCWMKHVVVEVGGELFDGFWSMIWRGKQTRLVIISQHCILNQISNLNWKDLKRFYQSGLFLGPVPKRMYKKPQQRMYGQS